MLRLEELTWSAVTEKVTPETVAILPIGAIEQHGFGPLGTDFFIAIWVAEKLADRLSNSILMPGLPFGMSRHHTAYAGTISFENVSQFQAVVEMLFWSLYKAGFRRIFVVNGHGGNKLGINQAIRGVQVFCQDLKILNTTTDYMDNTKPEISDANKIMAEICRAAGESECSHADAAEFSLLFAMRPETREMLDEMSTLDLLPDLTAVSGVRDPLEWKEKMAACRGGKGDPRRAQTDLGAKFLEAYLTVLLRDATEGWEKVRIEKPTWQPGTHEK